MSRQRSNTKGQSAKKGKNGENLGFGAQPVNISKLFEQAQGDTTGASVRRTLKIFEEQVEVALLAGDYRLAREINSNIIKLDNGGELGVLAVQRNQEFSLDPFVVRFICFAIALYGAGWGVAFFH